MKFLTICLALLAPLILQAEKIGTFEDHFNNPSLVVSGNHVYVGDYSTITFHIYSFPGLKKLGHFCRKGEGPGEFPMGPSLKAYPGFLLLNGRNKIARFTPEGKFLEQMPIKAGTSGYVALDDGYVASAIAFDQETGSGETAIHILNPQFKQKAELGRAPFGMMSMGPNGKAIISLVSEYFGFQVWQDRIYVADTRQGFHIDVFDPQGEKTGEIDRPYEKQKVTAADREQLIEEYKQRMGARYERAKSMIEFTFPDTYPAFRMFRVSDDRIEVYTHRFNNDRRELLILNLEGKLLSKTAVPSGFPSTVYQGTFYYLKENESGDRWELHAEKIY